MCMPTDTSKNTDFKGVEGKIKKGLLNFKMNQLMGMATDTSQEAL